MLFLIKSEVPSFLIQLQTCRLSSVFSASAWLHSVAVSQSLCGICVFRPGNPTNKTVDWMCRHIYSPLRFFTINGSKWSHEEEIRSPTDALLHCYTVLALSIFWWFLVTCVHFVWFLEYIYQWKHILPSPPCYSLRFNGEAIRWPCRISLPSSQPNVWGNISDRRPDQWRNVSEAGMKM